MANKYVAGGNSIGSSPWSHSGFTPCPGQVTDSNDIEPSTSQLDAMMGLNDTNLSDSTREISFDTGFESREEAATQSQDDGYNDVSDEEDELDLLLVELRVKLQLVERGKRRKFLDATFKLLDLI